jgi:putative endonuclease
MVRSKNSSGSPILDTFFIILNTNIVDVSIGKVGEDLAEKYLVNKDYYILSKNYHSRFGEIDIIASDGKSIVFVEVKTRTQNQFGSPLEATTKLKLSKMVKTSQFYLSQRNLHGQPYRFDAIEVIFGNEKPIINHITNITF